jgi:hypothetical protein
MEAKSILLLASESGDGQFRRLLDLNLKKSFFSCGLHCSEIFVPDVNPDDLALFNTIVIMRSPLPGHPKDDSDKWSLLLPYIVSFVENGGSLIIMFAESYGKTVGSLNELGELFDIQFLFNKLEESAPERCGALPNMPEGKLITCDFSAENPFDMENGVLDLIIDGGHGTQHLTCLPGDDWLPIIRGSESCTSTPFPYGHYANSGTSTIAAPVLAACREFGKGRVLAFPGSSPFWLANANLRRWKSKLLNQHSNSGYDFLKQIMQWSSTGTNDAELAAANSRFGNKEFLKQQDYSYSYLTDKEYDELKKLKPFRTWIGTISNIEALAGSVEKIKSLGYELGIFVVNYALFNSDTWIEFQKQCDALSENGKFLAMPAFEQADAEGNYCIVFNVDELPDMRESYPNSNMLEDLLVKLCSYSAVFARPSECRIPCWRHGGYNLLEVATKNDLDLYRDRISSCTFLSAVNIDRSNNPGSSDFDNWLMAESLETAPTAIRENRHFNFVSSGPVIKRFFWKSKPIMLDDWEGYWLEWKNGDKAEIEIELSGDVDISEVKLWDGETVIKSWQPDSSSFNTSISFNMEYDMRLHLSATDVNGGKLTASYPLYTRNRYFWAHVGSDQMNDYHNVWTPDPNGSIGVGSRIHETCGFVTIGFAWGDYLRIAPPVNWGDIMPQGVEVSSMVSNLQSFHPSPFINTGNGFNFLNNHRRKLGKCTQDMHITHSIADSSWLEDPEARWRTPDGRNISPTLNFTKSDLLQVEADYLTPQWQAGHDCEVTVNMRIVWLKNHSFAPHATISLGHSLNMMKENINFSCGEHIIDSKDFLMDYCESTHVPHKEWDNSGTVDLLALSLADGIFVEVPEGVKAGTSGDAMGDFLFRPVNVPGKVYMRGWQHKPGFILSFEFEPEQKEIKAGDIMDIQYILSVTPGQFSV